MYKYYVGIILITYRYGRFQLTNKYRMVLEFICDVLTFVFIYFIFFII